MPRAVTIFRTGLSLSLCVVLCGCSQPQAGGIGSVERWQASPAGAGPLPTEDAALTALRAIHAALAGNTDGKIADHTALSASADPSDFAIAIVTVEGDSWSVGDDSVRFPLQSMSKPFTFARVLEDHGDEAALERIGVHATGLPYGSLAATEVRATRLQNPMVSAGAIATTSLVKGRDTAEKFDRTLRFVSACAGRELEPMTDVFESEMKGRTGSLAKAHVLDSYGLFYDDPDIAVERYLQTCSIGVTARELAMMGATLANAGVNPATGERVMSRDTARDVLCAMIIAGMYDDSGPWLYRIGLPAKSGVSGCVLAVLPGRMAIAAYSPRLDPYGNSVRASASIERLAADWRLHVLEQLLP